MTTSSQTEVTTPARKWDNAKAQAVVDGYRGDRLTVTRADGRGGELVFVQVNDDIDFWLTPEQAADFAEAVHDVSGMQSSTYSAQFLAEVHRKHLARDGITQKQVRAKTGISRYRLTRILSGKVPMTHTEHVTLSEVRA